MAKAKGSLQIEVNNDEDWEKLLLKDGLIIVDIFSDWCGPCTGMAANLKKIKLEVGGDMLTLAMAKSDHITALERFRHKSEPTWMFISKGMMTNLVFGANAPEIIRIILDEIKKEKQCIEEHKDRPERMEITEWHPNEVIRYEERERILREAREKEEAKRLKDTRERKTAECHNIIENLTMGCLLIFPCAKERYSEVLADTMKEAAVNIASTEKVHMNVDMLEEMFYFYEEEEPPFDEPSLNSLLNNECILIAVKPQIGMNITDIDYSIRKMLYGSDLCPPGSEHYAHQKLLCEEEDPATGEIQILTGIWTPASPCIRATMLRMFFPKYTKKLEIPDPGPPPPQFLMIFETDKITPALTIMGKYPKQFLHYGFFTSDNLEESELVAKSVQRLENPANRGLRTYTEKLVCAIDRRKSECLLELVELTPIYMSPHTAQGAKDAELFFPEDYAESLGEDEEVYMGLKPKEPEKDEDEEEEEEGAEHVEHVAEG